MPVKGGRLEFLVPHLLRGPFLRPGFVRMSLRLGAARQMPAWAKLQFINAGVSPEDLDMVLGRITSLESWVGEWEKLGLQHEEGGRAERARGDLGGAARRFIAAASAYNFAQYVVFLDIARKRDLHLACTRAYAEAAPLLSPPARPFEVMLRRRVVRGLLRLPPGVSPAPVAILFHGTNGVKEELHWWSEALLERGIATLCFDGPGLGETFHRLSLVAEPRPLGNAILAAIEARPELDPGAVAVFGMSLGGFVALRLASHDPRIKAVAAVSPPYSISIYWNVTLAGMRRELAALYDVSEREMTAAVERMTLAGTLSSLSCPLMLSGGGQDLITPSDEAERIFDEAVGERELVFYPHGAHDCFNVLADLRPRMAGWLAERLEPHRQRARFHGASATSDEAWGAAEAVDPDFADELCGDARPLLWNRVTTPSEPVRWAWWQKAPHTPIEVVRRVAGLAESELRGAGLRRKPLPA